MCSMHYQRLRTLGDVGAAEPMYAVVGSTRTATCSGCGSDTLLTKFPRRPNGRRRTICSQCLEQREEARIRRAALGHEDRWRENNLKRYGLTVDTYEELLTRQGGVCAICGTSDPGGQGRFHVDHCHDTQRVRGLLCARCNVGIGMLGHDVEVLRTAIGYLST